jgi:hypothetical protein
MDDSNKKKPDRVIAVRLSFALVEVDGRGGWGAPLWQKKAVSREAAKKQPRNSRKGMSSLGLTWPLLRGFA